MTVGNDIQGKYLAEWNDETRAGFDNQIIRDPHQIDSLKFPGLPGGLGSFCDTKSDAGGNVSIQLRFGFNPSENSQKEEAGDAGGKNYNGFKHRIVSPVIRQYGRDNIGDGGFLHRTFNITWRHMLTGRCLRIAP